MYITIITIALLLLAVLTFLQLPLFGKLPTGKRLERIKLSPNYNNGSFQNISETPSLTEGASLFSVIREFFFVKHERLIPTDKLPTIKTNLHELDIHQDVLIWFGHSSYYMQVDGKRILVDPVLSGHASPFSFSTKSFKGTDIYTVNDIPPIDYLFITHDHWDHLDYKTVKEMQPRVKRVITGLGTGSHLERWGYGAGSIIELDWNETAIIDAGFKVTAVTARHFSGRGFIRNKTLWTSFVLRTPTMQLFIGGDSGYDKHFAEIGKTFGAFDMAILENGQYNKSWKHIHMMPNEVLRAAKELGARKLLAVHSSKFSLSTHPWDTPLKTITELNKAANVPLITPMIGEPVYLKDNQQQFSQWWEGLN